MDPWSALGYIFLGITLGIIGQIIRIGIGLKKTYDEASQKNVNLDSLFEKKQLLISLLIAVAMEQVKALWGYCNILEKTLLKKP